jgi:hypothetical protein
MSKHPNALFHFQTEKNKRFWYPTRPLFTLFTGLFLSSLGFIGILPISWALWFAAAFALDDLPITPIINVFTAINNWMQGRKLLKAAVMITAVSLAVIFGGLFGYFVLAQSPFAVKLFLDYIALTSCSPLLISLGAILGGYLAHMSEKISPFFGFSLGVLIASFIPFSPPLVVEIVFLSIAGATFVSSIVAKQAMRIYYKYAHGESNADGYELARTSQQQVEYIEKQAALFGVKPDELRELAETCKARVATHKAQATFLQEFSGERTLTTNSYKDIYHGLMNPRITPEQVQQVKFLIGNSQLPDRFTNDEKKAVISSQYQLGFTMHDGLPTRLLMHQVALSKMNGLDKSLVEPFSLQLTETAALLSSMQHV